MHSTNALERLKTLSRVAWHINRRIDQRGIVFRNLSLLITLVTALGCGASDVPTSPTDTPFVGDYALQSIDGSKLPYVFLQSGQSAITVTAVRLSVANGGSWSEAVTYQTVSNGQTATQVSSDGGTWLRSGSQIGFYLSPSGAVEYSGKFSTNRLDLVANNTAYVFTK